MNDTSGQHESFLVFYVAAIRQMTTGVIFFSSETQHSNQDQSEEPVS